MGANNCGFCGSPVQNNFQSGGMNQSSMNMNMPTGGQSFYRDYNQGGNVMPGMVNISSKKELINIPQCAELKKNLTVSAVIGYICCVISLVVNVFLINNLPGLLDVIIVLILTLGFHLKYEKGCAIGLLVYSIINFVYMLVSTGKPGGWLIVFTAIYSLMITVKLDKVWKDYKSTGMLPNEVVKIK